MADNFKNDNLLLDPLADVTRKERKMLLGISMLGISVTKTGLVPTQISALGINFAQNDQKTLLYLLSFVIIYFLFAFIIYASSDFLVWRRALRREVSVAVTERLKKMHQLGKEFSEKEDKELKETLQRSGLHRDNLVYGFSQPVSIIRAFFEFLLPIIVGLYGVFILWQPLI